MANPEHLAILKRGVQAWNEWRKNSIESHPDLRQLDLSEGEFQEIDLLGALLRKSNLHHSNFYRADFTGADLKGADLSGAELNQANFFSANLENADLTRASLDRANFRRANLYRAKLTRASLTGVDFSGVSLSDSEMALGILSETVFADVDLSTAKGLESVAHLGPSYIDISTLYKSGGNIPESFLRGAGVPETMITFMHSLVGKPIQFYSAFISYSTQDDDFAHRLHADLQAKGVRVWFAPEDLRIGDKFRSRIDEAIRIYDKLMVVLSKHSIQSQWVEKEVEAAFEKERREKRIVLFPIMLDDAVMNTDQSWAADIRRTRHIGDFRHWKNHDEYQKAFDRLLRDLQAES